MLLHFIQITMPFILDIVVIKTDALVVLQLRNPPSILEVCEEDVVLKDNPPLHVTNTLPIMVADTQIVPLLILPISGVVYQITKWMVIVPLMTRLISIKLFLLFSKATLDEP